MKPVLLRLSLARMRHLVAVLLLFGAFFAGSVDAVACEPLFEEALHTTADADESGGDKSAPDIEKHGLCAHGHCHHGVQFAQFDAAPDTAWPEATAFRATSSGPLMSIDPNSLKRPPRL